jgi:hypothetical protein
MIEKLPPAPHLVRVLPNSYGWVDHRLLRKKILKKLTVNAMALYLILVCAADSNGVSFYGDTLLCCIIGITSNDLLDARNCLVENGLIIWERPFYQLLDLSDFVALQ